MLAHLKHFNPITEVHIEAINLQKPFQDFAASFVDLPGTVVLLSGGTQDSSRYHFLATRPWLICTSREERFTLQHDQQCITFEQDPFLALRDLLQMNRLSNPRPDLPVVAGLFGYFSYDLKDRIEALPTTCLNDLYLPELYLIAPSVLVIQDVASGRASLCLPVRANQPESCLAESRQFVASRIHASPGKSDSERPTSGDFQSNYTKRNYIQAVQQIRDYICSGHVYQVNLSQRFSLDFNGQGYPLFQKLFAQNPAPFFAYVNAGDHEIISTSPERFLQRCGPEIETRPIKGTRPRGKTSEEDEQFKAALKNSPKDRAELSMIVDLLRNDLGKVSLPGTVRVAEHRRIEAYSNVFHLVSVVKGQLDPDKDSIDLIRAAFPGGSITGCPKVRSMEIIDELESHKRHIYTGSLGYLSFHDTLDLSIAIRTATLIDKTVLFSVGGGIVFDSDPEEEYCETLHKGQTLMLVLQGDCQEVRETPKVWFNGLITDAAQARLEIDSPGLQYGFGFFETLLVDQGKPHFLAEHIARLGRSWALYLNQELPSLSWKTIIARTIAANQLEEALAVVKILIFHGSRATPPLNHSLLLTARPYQHRLKRLEQSGLRLKTYPHSRQTPLADHKSCNYLLYHLAGQWAEHHDADEALILNPDGSLSETNSANLLIVRGKEVIEPASAHVLPGIMQNQVSNLLQSRGFRCTRAPFFPSDLHSKDRVFVTNSLMGAVAILCLDNRELDWDSDLAEEINQEIQGLG